MVDTGLNTQTGGRLKRVQKYVGDERFLLTYGDGVTDLNIADTIKVHEESGCAISLTAYKPGGKFGALQLDLETGKVKSFQEKPDGELNRHGLGARRVALLAPRGVLSKYRYPLGYVGAITKILGKVQKAAPHFGRRELYSEWGRSPGIWGPRKVPQRSEDTLWGFSEEGVSYSHVRGRQLDSSRGEESPNGAPRKMHAFCGVPGLEGEIKITRETKSLF